MDPTGPSETGETGPGVRPDELPDELLVAAPEPLGGRLVGGPEFVGYGAEVVCRNVAIAGDAHGHDGRHAVRCERAGSEFRSVAVDQPGEGYRRCLELSGDDCLVRGGEYRSTHHPTVNAASGTRIVDVDHVEAQNGRAAVKLLDGCSDVTLVGNVLYGGIHDAGTANLSMEGNRTPSR